MVRSRAEILEILEQKRQKPINFGCTTHSISVGNTAEIIATALKENGIDIDVDRVTRMGYLHDIGKMDGNFGFVQHAVDGYLLLKEQGYDEDFCAVCLTHSFIDNDPFCNVSTQIELPELESSIKISAEDTPEWFFVEYIKGHKFSLEDNLISLCDALCGIRVMTMEQRIVDVIMRHGVCSTTQEYIKKLSALKASVDEKLGYNLYELFPSVKENL